MSDFKTDLERLCKIAEWDPCQNDLNSIEQEIKLSIRNGSYSADKVKFIVHKYFPNIIYISNEGEDSKDAEVLLALLLKRSLGR